MTQSVKRYAEVLPDFLGLVFRLAELAREFASPPNDVGT